jgi:hypothetical protein
MKKSDLRIYITCFIPVILGSFITLFFYSDLKVDVFLFYDHERYIDNIFYDIYYRVSISIFTWYASKWNRKVFTPFFIVSLLEIVSYFTFYNQASSLIMLPILVLLIILYQKK